MLNREEIEKILESNIDIITYKADKDFRCLTSTEKALLENNNKIAEYIKQVESNNKKLIEKLNKKIRYFEECDEVIATSNDNYSDGTVIKRFIDEFKEILEIVKGEKE